MLSSKKLTFSLTSFIVLIAFGLVCFAPSVFADGRDDDNAGRLYDLTVTISAAESMIDVSYEGDADANNIQIATGRDREERGLEPGDLGAITLLVEFSHVVNLAQPGGTLQDIEDATEERDDDEAGISAVKGSGGNFGADDVYVAAYDKKGRALGVLPLDELIIDAEDAEVDTTAEYITAFRDSDLPGRQFLIRIDESQILNAYVQGDRGTADDLGFEVYSFVFFVPRGVGNAPDPKDDKDGADALVARGIKKSSSDHVVAHFGPAAHHHLNAASNQFRVDLVDDDQGDPNYTVGVSEVPVAADGEPDYGTDATPGSGTPGIVGIDQLRERTGFIESGAFDVRILLTEEPKGGFTTDLIEVDNGTATKVTPGATIDGGPLTDGELVEADGNGLMPDAISYYIVGTDDDALDITEAITEIPQATGRDNKYYQYFATITPNPDVDGYVTISIKQFSDNVKPVSKQYLPLTKEQRLAVTPTVATDERDARVMNETLMVRVSTSADTTSVGVLATAAYKTRQEDILDKVANEKVLAAKLVIPAGGYLVLGGTGVNASSAKLAEKLSAASLLYNTTDLALPFPADDLDNFFRNGGTLNLGYADIPAATDSGHDDSKAVAAADHADNTGYAGATTNAYAAGAVIINEIMWGLDGAQAIADQKQSQYIELHNPGTAAITIDSKEWVITVGSLPTGYTAIDTVSNNPATGYWAVSGNGGVTSATAENPTIIDLVSMSRVTGGTDGTAAASWAASMRPSANLSGRRIGSPGAANTYVMPAPPADPTVEPVTPAAAVAKSGDLMISEIMVASNDGRLPQWIEIANVSAAAVSASGWSLEVENDSADDGVVGAGDTIVIDLGDVEIGADQVALVVTKEGRDTSGIGDGEGDLRADRIINVQSDVSPDNARYSLISEMGFMISLIPPQTGAVRKPGDVVGNLEGGWELPASEGDRSSLIRREMGDAGEIMGTDAAGWVLASDTMLGGAYLTTYYGSADDMGTPGYNAGGNLPVELSKFGAKRDPLTGAVVITWSTQSELNNAGFFIKRSQQTKGKFVVVNPTMIAGAGTTAEKQSYTYTDATADPNIVYYYQIEDVSLDGNRQTLTRAHRLKGHIGAAGKATTTWGELKSSRE